MIAKILERVLPLERLIAVALRIGLLRKPLEILVKGYKKAEGVRTQGKLVLAGTLIAGALLGVTSWEDAKSIAMPLLGAAVPTLIDKIARVIDVVEKASKEVIKEAEKPA